MGPRGDSFQRRERQLGQQLGRPRDEQALHTADDTRPTVLVITHRLSTVVAADQILVLEHGRITEHGTRHELLTTDGRYVAMWAAQTRARARRLPTST
jgi:ABC-type transport system involved in cytochrome bd biosynthesis fused ATPase/permease subunit